MSDLKRPASFNPKKELYIPIEIKARELQSRILVGGVFALNGYRTYIASKSIIERAVKNKKDSSGTYLFKSGYAGNAFPKIRKNVELYCVLDEEIGVAILDKELEENIKCRANAIDAIDIWFSASMHITSAFKRVCPNHQSKVITTGSPKFDLWKKKFQCVYDRKSLMLKKTYGDFILFSSDFGFIDDKFAEKEIKKAKVLAFKNCSDSTSFIQRIKNAKKDFNLFCQDLSLYDKLPNRLPIIIRPHPSEPQHVWYQRLNNLHNIRVIYQGEISEWLHSCQALLHRGCTTAVQAALLGKPCFFWNPSSSHIAHEQQLLPYSLSVKVNSCSSLPDKNHIWTNEELPSLDIKDNERIYCPDQLLSSELIFNAIEAKDPRPSSKVLTIPLWLSLYARASQSLLMLIWAIPPLKKILSSHRKIRKLQDGIRMDEVADYLTTLFPGENILLIEIAPGVICIEKGPTARNN